MKHFLRVLLFCVAALPACAFTPNTSTGVFSAVSRRPQPDFQWTWSAQNSQAINVEFQQAVGVTSVLFRLSSPERGPYYLQVNNGVITPGPTSVVWQTLLPINPSNVPPAQTLPYFAEFLGFGSNNVQKTLAAGRVTVAWSIFSGTNAASFQTANIVYTNVGSFVVSIPSGSVETNHLGTTTMSLFATETAARVAADAALSNRISVASNALAAAVAAETAARVAADAALSNAVATSSNAAVAGVAAETSARTNADASILAQLVAASNSLHAVDVTLSNQIAALTGGGTSVVQETAARIAADAALSNKIDVVSNAFAAADSTTWGRFTAASNSLSTRIDAEIAARITAVAGVSNALSAASNSLSARIDAETAARVGAVGGVSNSLSAATNAFAASLTAASNTLNASIIAASNSLATQITAVNTGLSASAAATSNSLSARIIAASNTLNANIVATSNSMVAQVAAALAKAVTNNGVVINGQPLTNGLSLLVGGLATNATLLSVGGTNLPGPLALANSEGVTWVSTATGLAAVVSAAGTFTNLVWNGNANTAQAIVLGESNVVLRYTGGTSYVGLAGSITGDLTFNGAINANDNIEIANTKHLRFQDGGGTNTVHLEAVKGRLIITGAVDIVSGQAVPATINGGAIATGTPLYVQSETNAEARLSSNVWALADSTTNYARRTGDTLTGPLNGETAASFWPTLRAWNNLPFIGLTDGTGLNGLRVHTHPAVGGVGVLTLGAFIPSTVGPIQEFSWAGEIDSVNTVGDFWRLRHVGADGATQTVMRMVADSAVGHSAQLIISNGVFNGDGSGITNLPINGSGIIIAAGTGITVRSATTNAGVVTWTVDNSYNGTIISPGGVSSFTYASNVIFSALNSTSIVDQQWVVPAGVTSFIVKAWGAGGGGRATQSGGSGGFTLSTVVQTTPNTPYWIRVGRAGSHSSSSSTTNFGVPGGGNASGANSSAGGGGYSAVLYNTNFVTTNRASITNFICIAGGGGGANGGGLTGANGSYGAAGGTQTNGGASAPSIAQSGGFLQGASTTESGIGTSSGGGGGYWGGGACWTNGASGGGSGYGWYTIQGNNPADPDWQANWGAGGASASRGQDGKVIIFFNPQF